MAMTIFKEDLQVLLVFIGNRLLDEYDLKRGAFYFSALDLPMARVLSFPYMPCRPKQDKEKFREILRKANIKLNRIFSDYPGIPISIFVVLTWESAIRAKDLLRFFDEIKKKSEQKRRKIFVYPVIWDYCDSSALMMYHQKYKNYYLYNSGKADYLLFVNNAPAAWGIRLADGSIRLTEYINRVMGYDLAVRHFPNYDRGITRKIAHHLNYENFNAFTPRQHSLPKYPIIDEQPYFPLLATTAPCPNCGEETMVRRTEINENGTLATLCLYCSEKITFNKNKVGKLFDLWPEYFI